jgi:hypothetical protein
MSEATIFAISLGVTLLGLVISWGVYRRRGAASGLRGAALSLIPVAAAMTGVTEFVADLAFSPGRWAGVGVAALAVVLYLTSGVMLSRRSGESGAAGTEGRRERRAAGKRAPRQGREVESAGADPEMAEIEQILRDRGIK